MYFFSCILLLCMGPMIEFFNFCLARPILKKKEKDKEKYLRYNKYIRQIKNNIHQEMQVFKIFAQFALGATK